MKRGRPTRSVVRDNIVEILAYLGTGTGYGIAKVYNELFPEVTVRVVYYHLRKGLALNLFAVDAIRREEGEYSWGSQAEKIYYRLTEHASPRGNARIREFLEQRRDRR